MIFGSSCSPRVCFRRTDASEALLLNYFTCCFCCQGQNIEANILCESQSLDDRLLKRNCQNQKNGFYSYWFLSLQSEALEWIESILVKSVWFHHIAIIDAVQSTVQVRRQHGSTQEISNIISGKCQMQCLDFWSKVKKKKNAKKTDVIKCWTLLYCSCSKTDTVEQSDKMDIFSVYTIPTTSSLTPKITD